MTPPRRPSLLVVMAHPDDESLACGATIARAAAAGVRVTIASLTRGDAGPTADLAAAADASRSASAAADLGARRTRELEAAAEVLGASAVVVRDHADGMLPWIAADRLIDDIAALIASAAPDVVVTFGADGLYWHPDHIAVHERTTAAIARLAPGAPALYYVTLPPGQMQAVVDADPSHRPVVPGLADAGAFGAFAAPPTLVVPAGPFARVKLAALRCHASQLAESAFAGLSDDDAARVLAVEHFHRAAAGVPGPTWLDALAVEAAHA